MSTKFYKIFVYSFLFIFLLIVSISYYFIINSEKIKYDSSLADHKFLNQRSTEIIFEDEEKVNYDVVFFDFCKVLKKNDHSCYFIIGKEDKPFNGFSLFTLNHKFSKIKFYFPNNKEYYKVDLEELTISKPYLKIGDSIFGKLKVEIEPKYIGANKKYKGTIFFKTIVKRYE